MAHLIHSMASLSRAGRERGARKTNQDSSFAFRQYCRPHQAIAGVLDGHGPHGHTVSAFVKQHLPAMVAAQLRRRGEVAAPAALAAAFLEAQAGLRGAAASVNARLSGTTAVVALLQGRRLTCAWVGDSRAMLVRREAGGGVRGVALTRDHKPTQAGELARVLAAGGRVERLRDSAGREVGPHRVWLPGAWVPGLAMSRALGDFVAGSVGVSAQPETAAVEVEAGDEFLVVASDGVWEFIGTQEAAELVGGCASAEEACRAVRPPPAAATAARGRWGVGRVCVCVGGGWGGRPGLARPVSVLSDAKEAALLTLCVCVSVFVSQLVDASTRAWAEMDEGITDDITAVVARLLPPGAAQGQAAAAAQEPQEPQEPQA
jgi:serine/threonine protein phosphatase PrpC